MKKFHGSVFCLALSLGILSSSYYLPEQIGIPGQTEPDRMQESEVSSESLWLRYQKINPDLKAVLIFESGLLSLPVVQAQDNTFYLRKNFEGMYDRKGTPFLDCQDSLDDQAFLIYGHHVYYDAARMFSPLMQLEKQDGYEKNHAFSLMTGNEIRHYEIVSVFRLQTDQNVFDQRKSEFHNQKDYEAWISYPMNHNEIHSEEHPSADDTFCLLQTCVKENEKERLIVLARRKYR